MVTVAGAGMEDLRNQRRRLYFDVFRPRRVWRITSAGPLEFSSPWHGGLEHWWWQHDRGAGRPRDLEARSFGFDWIDVQIVDGAAVVAGVQRVDLVIDGKEVTSRAAFTDLFVIEDGGWRLAVAHSTDFAAE
jgi:hypothetical protein